MKLVHTKMLRCKLIKEDDNKVGYGSLAKHYLQDSEIRGAGAVYLPQ
jgi:hypothetical protein